MILHDEMTLLTRTGHNYGKQTRLWDKLFGTMGERIEGTPTNIDYSRRINMPLYNQDALKMLFGKKAEKST